MKEIYRSALLDDVIPFWTSYSIDRDFGGYLTCLNRKGEVFDTDKFMWLQARQVWTYSTLFNQVDPRQDWLEIARHKVQFITTYGQNKEGD
jgi:N-acylglucosamine 2-epimerase